jgi:predicted GIY-YIG superfamily endonuclease
MTFWLYILLCGDGSFYVGHTRELELRMAEHRAGMKSEYTRKRHPLKLVFTQEFPTREEALRRERQVKTWGHDKKGALVRGDWAELKRLARSRGK